MSLYCVYRPPFSQLAPRVERLPDGLTLAELVARMELPASFAEHGTVCVGGVPVPRGAWHLVRPKAVTGGVVNPVTFHAPIMGGGGGDGGKNPVAAIFSVGLLLLSGGAAAGFFQTASGLFAAKSVSAALLAGGISLVGSLLLNALVPPPTLDGRGSGRESQVRDSRRDASARGNVLEPNGVVTRVVGERRVFPPLLAEPLVTFDGEDEVVEAVYGLCGPHRLKDIQIGAAPASDIAGVNLETREGWPGDPRLLLINRYARTESVGQEITGHQVSPDDGKRLDELVDVSLAIPQPSLVATRRAPDEHQLQIAFGQGLGRVAAPSDRLRVPLRIRIRLRGAAEWRNLPEVHYQGADFRALRATIKLSWQSGADLSPTAGPAKGFVAAFADVPAQSLVPAGGDWLADPYFMGSGATYVDQNNLGSTGLRNYRMTRDVMEFYLDPEEFPRGVYEVEIRRGVAVRNASWSNSAYTLGGTIYNLFGYAGTPAEIPYAREDMADTLTLQRSVSIWNRSPVQSDDFALIAVRARNVNIERVSVLAGGYVRDWNGVGWHDWAITDNPAPHYRDVLVGAQNLDPLPLQNLDDAGLVEWRAACAAAGQTCNAVFEDTSVGEALSVIGGCGYARPYQSDRWGVIRDYDRSAEPPVQLFTPRNSANLTWSKGFARLPDGLRVSFDDAAQDYERRQITVFRKGVTRDTGRLEQVTYEGMTHEADVIARALYDLAQLEARATLFNIDVGHDAIVCRRGSLVGLVHDAVAENGGFARVLNGGANGVHLDDQVMCSNEPMPRQVADFRAVASVRALGQRTQAQIRYPDGDIITVDLANATGRTDQIVFADVLDPVPAGALLSTRVLTTEYRRMIVFDMKFNRDLGATLTLVDEAQEIFAA
ncbi:hypothetical protein [Roseinatronobacter sp.]|uniref:hypothetical protein n=1 Tax=Roseinatronobacter sp. TaxID=1945755 RepID=UPI003F72B9B1